MQNWGEEGSGLRWQDAQWLGAGMDLSGEGWSEEYRMAS